MYIHIINNYVQITDQALAAFELEEMAAQEVVDGPTGALLGDAKVRICRWY